MYIIVLIAIKHPDVRSKGTHINKASRRERQEGSR